MSEAKTGILLRRNEKKYFIKNPPSQGELVFALDTEELGMLIDGKTLWTPLRGIVNTVAGKQGDVLLNKDDVGLENVDNTADTDKPISKAVQHALTTHFEAVNPHKITKRTLGLENVDNTADIDKPISNLTQIELDKKISWEAATKLAGGKQPAFTDTTYSIKDGELSEFNFNLYYKNFIDNFNQNPQVLPVNDALAIDGKLITLFRADGSSQTIETQDTLYDDTEVRGLIAQVDEKIVVADDLITKSATNFLSANQGVVLKEMIDSIKKVIAINDDDFSTLQDIIEYIEANREKFNDLTIRSIKGLQAALDSKVEQGSGPNIAPNSDLLQGKQASDFVDINAYTRTLSTINDDINSLNEQVKLFETQTGVNQKISQAINDLNLKATFVAIENSINGITRRLNEINVGDFENSVENVSEEVKRKYQAIERKIASVKTEITASMQEIAAQVNSFDTSAIDLEVNRLKEKILKDTETLTEKITSSAEQLNNLIEGNKEKINEKANISLVNETREELTGSIDNLKDSLLSSKDELNASITAANSKISKLEQDFSNFEVYQNCFFDDEDAPRNLTTEDHNAKKADLIGNPQTLGTLSYFNTACKANLKVLEMSGSWMQIKADESSTNQLEEINFDESLETEIIFNYGDESTFRLLIGDYYFGTSGAAPVAVNLPRKSLLFATDYPQNIIGDKTISALRIASDETFGKCLERVDLNNPFTFQKIIVEQDFPKIPERFNRKTLVATYELTPTQLKIKFPEFMINCAIITTVSPLNRAVDSVTLIQDDKRVKLKYINKLDIGDSFSAVNFGHYLDDDDRQSLIREQNWNYRKNRTYEEKIERALDILGSPKE